jgi:C-terminal processing protease CtpA/Prc
LQRAGREFTSTLGMTIADVEGAAPPQVEVTALVDGGAAALQGVQVGDRVLMVNAQPATAATFADSIKDLPVGAPVRLEVLVDGKPVAGWLRTGIE